MSIELPPLNTPDLSPEERVRQRQEMEKREEAALRKLGQSGLNQERETPQAAALRAQLGNTARRAAYILMSELDRDFEKAGLLKLGDEEVVAWYIGNKPTSLSSLYVTRFGDLAGVRITEPRDYEIVRLNLLDFGNADLAHMDKDIEEELALQRMLRRR